MVDDKDDEFELVEELEETEEIEEAEEVEDEPEAVGWDAIDQSLAAVYGPGEPPFHYGTVVPAMLGGDDPLQGFSVYRCEEPVPHWHYVTYGFTELYDKQSDDHEVSGYGFELTFRLVRNEDEPPAWPMNLMQNLARYVFESGNAFQSGHHLDCQGKVAVDEETELRALLFVHDPALPPKQSPHGAFEFLQMVAITSDEYALCRRWKVKDFLTAIADKLPLYITDLGRPSLWQDPMFHDELERRAQEDRSGCGSLFVDEARFEVADGRARVIIGANAVKGLAPLLAPRLGFSQPLTLSSPDGRLSLVPGKAVRWRQASEKELTIAIPAALAKELSALLVPKVGTYRSAAFPALEFEVRRTEIKDPDGNTIEMVG